MLPYKYICNAIPEYTYGVSLHMATMKMQALSQNMLVGLLNPYFQAQKKSGPHHFTNKNKNVNENENICR